MHLRDQKADKTWVEAMGEGDMDYSRIIEQLKKASLFDLHRLQVAIDHLLEDPQRIQEIKSQLKPGQLITYFERGENRPVEAKVIRLKRKCLLVENQHDQKRWNIPFYWVNLDNVDTNITLSSRTGLDKNQVRVGDVVGFRDRQNNDIHGEVIRLNQKTVTVSTDDHTKWRVAYSLLYAVIEGERGYPRLNDSRIIDIE